MIDNKYFPLNPDTKFVCEGVTDEGSERNEVLVTNETKMILDISCVVVQDSVMLDGELIEEETLDWHAQDQNGSVWYFREDSKEFENGKIVSTEGSREAGIDGAEPGIVMEANPKVGDTYRQEYYKDEAEDMAQIIGLNENAHSALWFIRKLPSD